MRILSERGAASAAEIARATGPRALHDFHGARGTAARAGHRRGRAAEGVARRRPPGRGLRAQSEGGHLRRRASRAGRDHGLLVADVSHSVIFENTIPLGRDYSPAVAGDGRAPRDARGLRAARPFAAHACSASASRSPGPVAPDGRIQRASIVPTWAGVNIRDVFEPALERPIFADNESNCAAIAEMTWGAAVGVRGFRAVQDRCRRRRRDRQPRPRADRRRRRGRRVRPYDDRSRRAISAAAAIAAASN